ncbi:MAG: DUF488 domain-containing protein [Acidobacteria bacterium]|nr:DUF488 domain-containing protein [Acidobacteriota bacterium]
MNDELDTAEAEFCPAPVFTIGHSTRSWDVFLSLLQGERIANLVDVRSFPASRKFPHFNQKNLREALRKEAIGYYHLDPPPSSGDLPYPPR